MIAQGDRIGDYRILGTHPSGGLRAVHVARPQRVLITLHRSDDWRAQTVQLLRATSILDAVAHPGVAQVVGHGVLPDHQRWVACELVDGITLSEILDRRRLSVEEVLALLRDVGSVLASAHAANVAHGGLEAHHIIVATGARSFPIQVTGWTGAAAERAGDLYALGELAYRALTGRSPGAHAPELVPGIPGLLSALIVHLLAADPERRPSAADAHVAASAITGDRVRAAPRFPRPRWTPPPMPLDEVAEIIELVTRRKQPPSPDPLGEVVARMKRREG